MTTLIQGIIGTPNETKEDMISTANFFIKNYNRFPNLMADVSVLVVHPGSELWNRYMSHIIRLYPLGKKNYRWYIPLFADKWKHLPSITPNLYRAESTTLKRQSFERFINMVMARLQNISYVSKNNLGRHHEQLIKL
jgi:radical SAM superfamily enzyme YgiQ (UPF0313 family)